MTPSAGSQKACTLCCSLLSTHLESYILHALGSHRCVLLQSIQCKSQNSCTEAWVKCGVPQQACTSHAGNLQMLQLQYSQKPKHVSIALVHIQLTLKQCSKDATVCFTTTVMANATTCYTAKVTCDSCPHDSGKTPVNMLPHRYSSFNCSIILCQPE